MIVLRDRAIEETTAMRIATTAIAIIGLLVVACQEQESPPEATGRAQEEQAAARKPASNLPPLHENNIVSIASRSEDHTTLVTAIQAADYTTAVAASGPLTVFAPTNAAFDALPEGTVDSLLEPDNADQLREILKYHVTTSALGPDSLRDGQKLGMANGAKTTIRKDGDTIRINDATVIASQRAENGMLYVIDGVLLPPEE
jgi:uncharacterized surface protein with fasciclin (FAS1) repeats